MKKIYLNIFNTEIITKEIYDNVLKALSKPEHLKKLIPKPIFSITEFYNSLNEISNLSEEQILKMPKVGIGKLNKIKAFQNSIKDDQDYFINYYCLNEATIKLPLNYDDEQDILISFSEMMKDLMHIYNLRADKKGIRNAKTIELYYGIDGKMQGRDKIGEELNVSTKRVDQILTLPNESVTMQLLLNNDPQDRIMADPLFFDKVLEIKNNSLWNHKFIDSITSPENPDSQFVARFTENLHCLLTEIEEDHFLVEQSNAVFFREHYRALKQSMNEQIEPLDLEEIQKIVSKEIKKIKVQTSFIEKLLEQDIYEKIMTDDGHIKYSIQWYLLSSQVSKVKRILFEEGKPLVKDEILEEFNKRSSENGLELITIENLFIRGDEHLISYGNNVWKYVDAIDGLENERLPPKEFISQFVKSNGGLTEFKKIKEALEKENYNHTNQSIRAYILKSCFVTKKDKLLFVHSEMTDKFPEIEYYKPRNSDLGKKIMDTAIAVLTQNNNQLGKEILYNKISKTCLEEGFIIERKFIIDYRINKLIEAGILYETQNEIILDSDGSKKYKNLSFRKEPKYKSTIRSLVINYLKSNDNKATSLQDFWGLFHKYYPENITKNNFYKIFIDANIFEKSNINNKVFLNLNTKLLPIPKGYAEEVNEQSELIIQDIQVDNNIGIIPQERIKFDIVNLTTQLKKELKNGFNMTESSIERGISLFYKALEYKGGISRWGDALLQSIFELWFTKTDFYDREVCLIRLTTNFETYIKNLYPTKIKTNGLAELLKTNRILSDLRSYKFDCQRMDKREIDYSKRNYSIYVNSLIYFRNLYAHNTDDESLDMGISKQINNATNFIALYIYAAALSDKIN